MISPWERRGKALGSLIGRWCLLWLALGSPWTVWRPTRPCGSIPLDRLRKGPRHRPHASHRADRLAGGGWKTRPLGPLRPLRGLRPTGPGCKPIAPLTLAPSGHHRPTDPPAHPMCPRDQGAGRRDAWPNTHRHEQEAETPFGHFDRQSTYAINLGACAAIGLTGVLSSPCNKFAPLHSITSSARASRFGGMVRPSVLAVLRFTIISNFVGS
jgi:hypothetical protein